MRQAVTGALPRRPARLSGLYLRFTDGPARRRALGRWARRIAHNVRRRYRSPVRLATWNVNSVKQRVERLLPWLEQRSPDVVCLQETKLTDEAFAELLGEELGGSRIRDRDLRGSAVERGRDPLAGRPRGRGTGLSGRTRLSRPGGKGAGGHLRRGAGAQRLRSQRACPGLRPLSLQAAVAGGARAGAREQPARGARVRGPQHRAHRRRRVRSGGLRGPHARDPRRAGGARAAAGARAARRDPRALAERARVHLLGLPGRHVPPGPRHAHRPDAGGRGGQRSGEGGVGGPPGPQGLAPERPRPRDRGPRRGARRRHRAGRTPPSAPARGRKVRLPQSG